MTRLTMWQMNALGLLVIVALAVMSLGFGIKPVSWPQIWQALTAYDPADPHHVIVRDLRLSRVYAAVLGGAALGLCGVLMQVMTRNPLAEPGLLGINGGAAIGVVVAIWGFGVTAQTGLILPAMIGALLAALLVLLLGGAVHRNGPDPTRLILAGAALNALFIALTWAILILSREALDVFRFWVLGGFAGVSLADVLAVLPIYVIAVPLGLVTARLLTPLVLGDDVARALGVRIWLVRLLVVACTVALCGATVSLAGPIAFIGLMVPHLMWPFARSSILYLATGSALFGACLTLLADIIGRFLLPGQEIEAGLAVALIGGPALVLLVRTRREVPL